MKRIFLFFFLCSMTVLTTFAQEKKADYTLEDVIPGGNNYFNLMPKNIPGNGGGMYVYARTWKISAVSS